MKDYSKEITNLGYRISDLQNAKVFRNNLFTEEYKKNFPNIDEELERCQKQINQLKFEEYTSYLKQGKYYKYNVGGDFRFIYVKTLTDKKIVEESISFYTLPTNNVIHPATKKTYTNTTDNEYLLGNSALYIEITKDEYDRAYSIVKNITEAQKTLQKIMA